MGLKTGGREADAVWERSTDDDGVCLRCDRGGVVEEKDEECDRDVDLLLIPVPCGKFSSKFGSSVVRCSPSLPSAMTMGKATASFESLLAVEPTRININHTMVATALKGTSNLEYRLFAVVVVAIGLSECQMPGKISSRRNILIRENLREAKL
jgi:hypothetical protein